MGVRWAPLLLNLNVEIDLEVFLEQLLDVAFDLFISDELVLLALMELDSFRTDQVLDTLEENIAKGFSELRGDFLEISLEALFGDDLAAVDVLDEAEQVDDF